MPQSPTQRELGQLGSNTQDITSLFSIMVDHPQDASGENLAQGRQHIPQL